MQIEFEKHVLANGLRVVLHQDRSDPVVAVFVYYHVGSARERPGLSGFAHLFEHMLFQGSQNVPSGEHFRLVQEAGGTLNGTTNQDRTNYFEILPANRLELALWLESDRMGFLLPALSQEKLETQRAVVKNERRQSYENRPYGLVHETLLATLYPPGHPYSWPTIGSMADIDAATLEDVAAFFRRWYGPNNATLVVGGDFDRDEALALVERWFGGLPEGEPVDVPAPRPAALEAERRVVLEDRVQLPQLSLVWPTVHAWHPDEPALDLLSDVLSANKASLLDRVLVTEEELASHVTIQPWAGELAGALRIDLRPAPGVSLARLEERVDELLEELLERGVTRDELERHERRREGTLVRHLETVAARASLLGHFECFFGDPDRLGRDVERHRAVTPEDVLAAARRWIVRRPRVALSVVPAGRRELASPERSVQAVAPRADVQRSGPPPAQPLGRFRSPAVWRAELAAGPRVTGLRFDRVPLARLSLALGAGRLREGRPALGLSSLLAELLEEGTETRSSAAWTEALDGLGATFAARAGDDELVLALSAPAERFGDAVRLLAELLAAPRFVEEDFERLRRLRLVALDTLRDRPRELADDLLRGVLVGRGGVRGGPRLGTRTTVEALTLEGARSFLRRHGGPGDARIAYVGALGPDELEAALAPLAEAWPRSEATGADAVEPPPVLRPGFRVHLVDAPGAAQAELRVGHPGVARGHADFDPLRALNHLLGGAFSSRINLNLREEKGYTYGARSAFEGGRTYGTFSVAAAVESRHVAAATAEVRGELERIREGVTQAELEFTRASMTQALARAFESTRAKLGLLEALAKYDLPDDYPERRHAWLEAMRAEDLDALARRHVHPEVLDALVVGDAASLRAELGASGELHALDPDAEAAVPAP